MLESGREWIKPILMNDYSQNRPKQDALAANLLKIDEPGMTLRKAFLDAGYSQSTADGGWDSVPNKVVKLLAKKGIRLLELGKITPEQQENLVRGRLVYNTLKGSDKGVMSAKALGSDRRVNMFVPDSATGLIVLQMPQSLTPEKLAAALTPPDE